MTGAQGNPEKISRDQGLKRLRTLVSSRRIPEARRLCVDLSNTYPDDIEIWTMRRDMHLQFNELDEVVACCARIVALDVGNTGAYFIRGVALHRLRRLDAAEASYRKALETSPEASNVIAQLAMLLREQRRFSEARTFLENAVTRLPREALVHYAMGLLLLDIEEREAAFHSFGTAVKLNPRFAEAHNGLGFLHYHAERHEQAIAHLERATQINPGYIDALRTLATAYSVSGCAKKAMAVYERITALSPGDVEAHMGLAIHQLLLGDFNRGWPEYEWRLKFKDMVMPVTGKPHWNGQSLTGKTILLLGEQGLGDTLQFVRYAPQVKAHGANVVLGCPPTLQRLLSGCEGIDSVIPYGETIPPHDFLIPLLSLPRVLKTTLKTIPASVPYLRVPSGAGVTVAGMITRQAGILNIGIAWAGGNLHPNNKRRSCTLEQFRCLLDIPGVRFFSLQKGEPAKELSGFSDRKIVDLGPFLGDFSDTAAAMTALDLIISVDTAAAHLAGGLARPVWLLLPFAPDWRWMLGLDDSPWYPTMRLFRQPVPGDWNNVTERLAAELAAAVSKNAIPVY